MFSCLVTDVCLTDAGTRPLTNIILRNHVWLPFGVIITKQAPLNLSSLLYLLMYISRRAFDKQLESNYKPQNRQSYKCFGRNIVLRNHAWPFNNILYSFSVCKMSTGISE